MLPRLEIRSQAGTLNIRTQNARLQGTPPGLELSIRGNSRARIEVKSTHPRIIIDQSPSWESVGLEKPLRNIEKFQAESNQRGIEQIGRIAREGLEMMRIERGGSGHGAIPRIAARKGMKNGYVTLKDIAPPNISAQMGEVKIRDVSGKIETKWLETADTTRYTPGYVSITWGLKPSLEISVVPGTELELIGQGTGANLDTIV